MSFDVLHPAIQYHVVNSLGWRSLRPLQEKAIIPLVAGAHALLVAPTAAGKTEAALFPLLSRAVWESWRPLSILYVCPLRALLNNLEQRVAHYARLLGRSAQLWHGDVPDRERKAIRAEPPDILLTTPESIEVLLTTRGLDRAVFFGSLRAVVVDELHAFAGDDRGWHLMGVLARVEHFCGRLQRVGLSATVGNPESLLDWLVAGSAGDRVLVREPPLDGPEPDVRIDAVGSLENAATVISRLHRGEKRLVFCDSRSRVEDLAQRLRGVGVSTFVSHGSLAVEERRSAEAAFAEGRDCVIVATSTLELGLDVGDLDRVIQIGAPPRVASFLQRLGRTGRRAGAQRNLLFLTTTDDELLVASALVSLWRRGFVESLQPPPLPLHILAQQLVCLVHQEQRLSVADVEGWLTPFARQAGLDSRIPDLLDHLLSTGLLFADEGLLGLGPVGDRRFTGRGFMDLLAVFSTPPLFTILYGRQEIGRVHEASFQTQGGDAPVVVLAGRAWIVGHVDWKERVAYVEPTTAVGRSLWRGYSGVLSFELARAMVTALHSPAFGLTRRGEEAFARVREAYSFVPAEGTCLQREGHSVRWWTFAGGRANATLSELLGGQGARVGSSSDLSLTLDVATAERLAETLTEIRGSNAPLRPRHVTAEAVDALKFSFCIPRVEAEESVRSRLSDEAGTDWVVRSPLLNVSKVSRRDFQ